MSSEERTQYSNSILVAQKPIDATEIVRVRLSQAKLLNDEFANFFKKYYTIKSQYLSELNKLVSASEDLNKNIEYSIIENQVLSREEMEHYNIDAIGELSGIWNRVITEIKDEISANNSLRQVVERELIHPLSSYTTKNKGWSQVRDLHSKLSEVAQTIEYNQEKVDKYNENPSKHHEKLEKYQTALQSANNNWAAEAPFVFEVFENTDFGRLSFLRDSLLRFITAYTDSLNKVSASNEKTLETILNFNPETEISRFAQVSSQTKYIPKETRKAAESPQINDKRSTFPSLSGHHHGHGHATPASPLSKRHSSVATTATTATTATSATTSTKDEKAPKQRTKLRSKVGSIFGKKKNKNKNLKIGETLPESEASSLRESTTATNNRLSRTSSLASGPALSARNNNTGRQYSNGTDQDSLYQPRQTTSTHPPNPVPKNDASPLRSQQPLPAQQQTAPSPAFGVPLSVNQVPLQPSSRSNTSTNLNGASSSFESPQRHVSDNSYNDQTSQINVAQEQSDSLPQVEKSLSDVQLQDQQQPQQPQQPQQTQQQPAPPVFDPQQQTQQTQQQQHHHAPPPPPSRKTHTFGGNQNLTNIREDGGFTFAADPNQTNQTNPTDSQSHVDSASQSKRRDIQSGLFTNLNQSDLENHNNRRISSFNSFGGVGSINQLRPQTTGSSLSTSAGVGLGLFNHPAFTNPGLNASIAEVINAKFKDGEQVSSQIIGEIAFNYQKDLNGSESDVGSLQKTNLKISGIEKFDKIIPNNQLLKQIDSNEFEISINPILSRTLGGLKYSIKDTRAPIVVLPAWRFEPHQSSVMLTIKLIPEIAASLTEGEFIQLDNLIVSVAIQGVANSALSKPLGTFNKEKSRISWRFTEPVKLNSNNEQKLVARFITETEAKENEQGVLVKFSVNDEGNSKFVTTDVQLETENVVEDDPFAQEAWNEVPTFKTLVAGNYSGL